LRSAPIELRRPTPNEENEEMIGSKARFLWPATSLLLVVAGCGSTDPGATDNADGGGQSCTLAAGTLLPWKAGNKWTYKVTEDGVVTNKVTTIGDMEPVGGMGPHRDKMAHKVITKKGVMDQTISWQVQDGTKVIRYREQSFGAQTGALELEEHWDPYKLHIDGSKTKKEMWLESYQETKLPIGSSPTTAMAMDFWTVIAECERITVEGRTWEALKVTKASPDVKTYWYVPGVGKVKETGALTEELVSHEVLP
jgi:hypothetical protein